MLSKAVAAVSSFWSLSSPSFPRSGLGAGEVVEVRRAWFFASASPAGLGGEGRSGWSAAVLFGCWWFGWASSSTLLFWPAVVARGTASGGGGGFVVVVLGGVPPAGRRVVAGTGCCGRVRSATLGSVLKRRTALAAFYKERTIYKLTKPYKSSTNELVNVGNREIVRLLNLSGDERCASLFLQAKPRTRHLSNKIRQANEKAQDLATKAVSKSLEVEALGGKAIKVPGFFRKFPLL